MFNNSHHAQHYPPEGKKFFTQICSVENMDIPEHLPCIEQIVSSVVDPEILSVKIIDTMKGTSYEGQELTGKKAVIELKLKQKVLYVAWEDGQSVHIIESAAYQSAYVVIPCLIEGTDPAFLLKHKMLKCDVKVEDVFIKKVGERKIYKNVCLLITLNPVKTFEICFTEHHNCTCSNIHIMHADGAMCSQITFDNRLKNIKPQWSPNGKYIAFLSGNKTPHLLQIYSLSSCSNEPIMAEDDFKGISSFCWSSDSSKIIFAASKEHDKELYSINIYNLTLRQLTYGNGIIRSYKPSCSPNGHYIACIRSVSGLSDLWIMDNNGLGCEKITSCGCVKSLDWSKDGGTIAYVCSKYGAPDEIHLFNIKSMKNNCLQCFNNISNKRNIRYSPDNSYIAFIGSGTDTENVYTFKVNDACVDNITQNGYNIKISDFIWNADSSRIYYSSNELHYYNIFYISLATGQKKQLTHTAATEIELFYRPRIG